MVESLPINVIGSDMNILFFNKNLNADEQGFTLLELAIVIFVAGILLGLAVAFAVPLLKTAERIETEEKMAQVSDALNSYAVRNYRLPCPATPNNTAVNPPYGSETGSGANGDQIPAICPATIGTIPWRTLGLEEDMVRDGFGNIFTYAISPTFSQNVANAETLAIHPSCRTLEWYSFVSEDEINDGVNPPFDTQLFLHRNPRKALFCCPGTTVFAPATDIVIQDAAGQPSLAAPRQTAAAYISDQIANTTAGTGTCPPTASCAGLECCSAYNLTVTRPFSIAPNASINNADRSTAVAYVIISHGPNGDNAAYNINTGARPVAPPVDLNEQENWNDAVNTNIFSDLFIKDDNYDDILLWQTQDLIFAAEGESCAVP